MREALLSVDALTAHRRARARVRTWNDLVQAYSKQLIPVTSDHTSGAERSEVLEHCQNEGPFAPQYSQPSLAVEQAVRTAGGVAVQVKFSVRGEHVGLES